MAVTAAVADEPEPTGPLEPFEPADRAVLAFHHAAEVGDWDELDRLWSAGIVAMVRDDAGLLRRTLDHLPAPVVAARPSMGVFRDALPVWASDSDEDGYQATLRAYADSSARYLGPAWEQLPMGDLLIVGTGYLVHLRLAGRLVESAAVGARIAGVLVGQRPSGRALDGRTAWFHLQRAMTSTVLLDDAAAIRAYHRAWERGTGAGVDVVRAHAAANLAFTFALEGDGPRSRRWSDRSRSIDVRGWPGQQIVGLGVDLADGFLALDRLDDLAVERCLRRLGERADLHELWPFVAFLAASHAVGTGRATEGLVELDRSQALHADRAGGEGAAVVLTERARADLLLACGRGDPAAAVVERAGGGRPWMRVPAARLRVLGPDPDRRPGPGRPGSAPVAWAADTPARDRDELLLLGAIERHDGGDRAAAARMTAQALDHCRRTGSLRPVASVAAGDAAGLLSLAGQALAPADATRLAGRPRAYPATLVRVGLSGSEQSVLVALSGTPSRKAIAASLYVSVNTIKSQLTSVYRKLGCTNRADALRVASEQGLLP